MELSTGYYFYLPEIKTEQEALEYFKQYFPNEAKIAANNVDDSFTEFEIMCELMFEILPQDNWKPFCDIKRNWGWIKYIYDENDDIQLSLDTLIKERDYFANNVINDTVHYKNFKLFIVDWETQVDFPLILK